MKPIWLLLGTGLLLLITGCTNPSNAGTYFEITYENPDCNASHPFCFDEWLGVDDGLVLHKYQLYGEDYQVSLCQSPPARFETLLAEIDQNLLENRATDCRSCANYHMFINNGSSTRYSMLPEKEAIFEASILKKARQLCTTPSDARFIHIIFGKSKTFDDYHVFSTGKVVFEQFSIPGDRLVHSTVTSITPTDFTDLEKLIPPGFFAPSTDGKCPANGFFYGFVEVLSGDQYAYNFTCGGDSPKDQAFQQLVEKLT